MKLKFGGHSYSGFDLSSSVLSRFLSSQTPCILLLSVSFKLRPASNLHLFKL